MTFVVDDYLTAPVTLMLSETIALAQFASPLYTADRE